jgi:hypothetical protein
MIPLSLPKINFVVAIACESNSKMHSGLDIQDLIKHIYGLLRCTAAQTFAQAYRD